jgi:YYY domain-containing protein
MISEFLYIISWFLIIEIIGLISFPIVLFTCPNLNDKGYSLSKTLGILLLTFVTWILVSLHILKFGQFSILFSGLIITITAALLSYKCRINPLKLLKENKNIIIKNELVFTISFLVFLLILIKNPNIFYSYSEDFMDYGFIKAILRTEYFPPADPWYAGSSLTYYYGGHLIIAIMTVLSGVPSFIAYNIGGAMFFALTVLASYGLGYNLTHKSSYGLLTALFVAFTGFLSGFLQFTAFVFPDLGIAVGYQPENVNNIIEWFFTYPFHDINRIIPNTLNFYPGFVFLQGDIHGHMTSIPFQVAYISYIYGNIVKRTNPVNRLNQTVEILIMGIFLGFFLFINSWNYPTYVIFTGLAIALAKFRGVTSDYYAVLLSKIPLIIEPLVKIVVVSVIIYSPYLILSSSKGFYGIGLIGGRTQLSEFLEIFALFVFILATLMWFLMRNDPKTMAWIVLLSFLLAWISGFHILIIVIPIILASVIGMQKALEGKSDNLSFVLLLAVTGTLLVLFCDLFYISDSYAKPYHRMNTVMKIYLEIWIFLGIASANALYFILRDSSMVSSFKKKFSKAKAVWVIILISLIIASVISPLAMSLTLSGGKETLYGKTPSFDTLNGLDYLFNEYPWDLIAIDWIDKNIDGSHTVVESPGDAYTYSSRVSSLTGLSTVIGWRSHEQMWRGIWSGVGTRQDDANHIFNSECNEKTLELLEKYDVEYIYIGELEREKYSKAGLQKFEVHPESYELVYENSGVSIYSVKLSKDNVSKQFLITS